jgi:hypothetical protein
MTTRTTVGSQGMESRPTTAACMRAAVSGTMRTTGSKTRTSSRPAAYTAPRYRIQFEADGTVSLCEKRYRYWPERPAVTATCWAVLSRHPDLEDAERRLRHVTTPPIYYDERGRPVLVPPPAPPAWGEDDADLERGPPLPDRNRRR